MAVVPFTRTKVISSSASVLPSNKAIGAKKTIRISKAENHKKKRYEEIQWRDLISDEIRMLVYRGKSMKDIAEEVGLSPSTISKLVYGVTVSPSFKTMIVLMRFLGFKMYAER